MPWCHPGEELVKLPKIWKWEGKGEQQCFGTAAVTAWEGKCDEWELLGGTDPGLDGNLLGPAAFRFHIPLFSNQILGFKSHRSGEKFWL